MIGVYFSYFTLLTSGNAGQYLNNIFQPYFLFHLLNTFLWCLFLIVGYVKTTSVEIDFNTLKNRKAQQAYDPEVYDDIDVASSDNRYQNL